MLREGVVRHIEAMASGLAALLAELGIDARWRRDLPGLWVEGAGGDGGPAKICAFGVHVRQRIAIHGFALNVTTSMDAFDLIVPCGLAGAAVTSVASLVGVARAPALALLAARAADMLGAAYGASIVGAD
jgi:lipoyl(octanoyl) transferase